MCMYISQWFMQLFIASSTYLGKDGHLRPRPYPRASVAHFLQSKFLTPHGSCTQMQSAIKALVSQLLPEMRVTYNGVDLCDFLLTFTYTVLAKILLYHGSARTG